MADGQRTIIRGGDVFDADSGRISVCDVHLVGGLVGEPFEPMPSDEIIDATGLLVTPGWVDLHTHVFNGQDLGIDPGQVGPRTGVTTMIDAGSAGAHLYDAFSAALTGHDGPRVRAFLNISTIGTTSILLAGELRQLDYVDVASCRAAIEAHPEILGVKIRASANVGGENVMTALHRARDVADQTGRPLMVHVGPPPARYDDVLDLLRAGDIVTHCFSPHVDSPPVDPDTGAVSPPAAAARERGVHFDVGHGGGSFSARRVSAALRAGFLPDSISSDIHSYADAVTERGLPLVADKMLALGLGLEEILSRVTLAPAAAIGLSDSGVGTLRPGAPADVAMFRIDTAPVSFVDTGGDCFDGQTTLTPVRTLQAGTVVFEAAGVDDQDG